MPGPASRSLELPPGSQLAPGLTCCTASAICSSLRASASSPWRLAEVLAERKASEAHGATCSNRPESWARAAEIKALTAASASSPPGIGRIRPAILKTLSSTGITDCARCSAFDVVPQAGRGVRGHRIRSVSRSVLMPLGWHVGAPRAKRRKYVAYTPAQAAQTYATKAEKPQDHEKKHRRRAQKRPRCV